MTRITLHIAAALRITAIKTFVTTAIAFTAIARLALPEPAFAQAKFSSEREAQQHCPRDTVVWLNIPTRIFHMQGMRWYGATRNGAYVCQAEAIQTGNRATRNGE